MAMDDLRNYIVDNGVSLESIGVDNYALSRADSLRLLNLLKEQQVSILGGDVYASKCGQLLLTYDNWYSDKDAFETEESFCARSISEAEKYISGCLNADVYFAFVLGDCP